MKSVRQGYELYGIEGYYEKVKDNYLNPKAEIVRELVQYGERTWDYGNKILDMCCGSGEVTLSLKNNYEVLGLDCYTYELYKKNTHKQCLQINFDDIVLGKLYGYKFDTIISSFALHLCEESKLDYLLWQLGLVCQQLIIITPHKRPYCAGAAFEIVESYEKDRCKIILYHSKIFGLLEVS